VSYKHSIESSRKICSNSKSISSEFEALWLDDASTLIVRGNVLFPYLPGVPAAETLYLPYIFIIIMTMGSEDEGEEERRKSNTKQCQNSLLHSLEGCCLKKGRMFGC
jgi:hypothetical protein